MKILASLLFMICITANPGLAQNKTSSSPIAGKWTFVSSSEIEPGQLPDGKAPDLFFPDSAHTVTGYTGCNKINGSYEIEGEHFIFGPMVSTYKACPDMDIEKFITRFLTRVGYYRIDNDRLYLYDKEDKSKFVMYKRNNLI